MIHSIAQLTTALKNARIKKGLSQRELGKKTGIPQSHLSKIEGGTIDLQASSLVEIARVLDLEPMLIPKKLIPIVESLINPLKNTGEQVPRYQLKPEDEYG